MSETTVDQLPEEVLVEVFKWLDTKSLKNAVLTCREWKEVVERSISWTLRLEYMSGEAPAHQLMLVSNRKYDKAVISGCWITKDYNTFEYHGTLQILETLAKHGGRIRELKLIGWTVCNHTLFRQVLNTMPKLESVVLQDVTTREDQNTSLPLALKNLKSLDVSDSSYDVFKFFEQCQIQKLKMCSNKGEGKSRQLLDFLATQECLVELELRSDNHKMIALIASPIPEESIQFRLKKLSLTRIVSRLTPNCGNNLINFVKLHVKSLEELEVIGMHSESFFEFVFAQLKHLKTLKLDTSQFSPGSSLFARLAVNTNVTSLCVTDSRYLWSIKGFINRLPNIENLTLDCNCTSDHAKYIAENLKKLKKFTKKFTVKDIFGREFSGLRFHALETLHFIRIPIRGSFNWDVFTKDNSGITDLWIGTMWFEDHIDIEAITQNLNLRQLTIESCKLSCDEKFFEIIRKNCSKLESLQLNAKSLQVDISAVADIPNLRFRDFGYV